VAEVHAYVDLKESFLRQWDADTGQVNVVFAQGKTGTSTIAAGLKRAGLHPVFQIHTLRKRMLAHVESEYMRRPNDSYPRHVWEAQWLGEHLPSEQHPWLLVTSVRDPIARIVSRFFQQKSRFGELEPQPTAASLIAELAQAFQQEQRRFGSVGWDWFEFDLRPILGQSVYDTPFDPARGYGTVAGEHIRALLLRGESLDKAPEALEQHFGRKVDLASENVGTDKDYGPLYRAVLDGFRPPPDYVEKVYDTRQARHFYADEELEGFRRHWTRPIAPTA
jgi:hypothetical protein